MAVIVFGLVSIATILLTYVTSRRMELRLRERLAGVATAEAGRAADCSTNCPKP